MRNSRKPVHDSVVTIAFPVLTTHTPHPMTSGRSCHVSDCAMMTSHASYCCRSLYSNYDRQKTELHDFAMTVLKVIRKVLYLNIASLLSLSYYYLQFPSKFRTYNGASHPTHPAHPNLSGSGIRHVGPTLPRAVK